MSAGGDPMPGVAYGSNEAAGASEGCGSGEYGVPVFGTIVGNWTRCATTGAPPHAGHVATAKHNQNSRRRSGAGEDKAGPQKHASRGQFTVENRGVNTSYEAQASSSTPMNALHLAAAAS